MVHIAASPTKTAIASPPAPKLKLFYFAFPGRAELARMMLTYGGVPFEDVQVTREEWPALKPSMPFGALPVLEVDGRQLAQSQAIGRFAARLAGLLPDDAWEEAKVEEATCLMAEVFELLVPTFSIPDLGDKVQARERIASTTMRAKLGQVAAVLGDRAYFGGAAPNFADFTVYSGLSNLVSGFFDGLGPGLLADQPALQAFHARMAALPALAARYQGAAPGTYLAAFKGAPATVAA